jgi:hypothetical protein
MVRSHSIPAARLPIAVESARLGRIAEWDGWYARGRLARVGRIGDVVSV